MTREELEELEQLSGESCPCFAVHMKLGELMNTPGAPGMLRWLDWVQGDLPQDFLQSFHPEFKEKVNRYVELHEKRRRESNVPVFAF